MFYAQFVLAKKGPLAKIWLAAHWEKKLTKAQIYETDVPQAIEEVIRPKVKMALRTVGHLLLGIVRIYSKKTRYLLADTNEAYLKMKVNFRDGFSFEADVPLDPEIDENFENVDDFNITVPEFLEADYNEKLIMANVSRLEDITMKDDCNFEAHFRMNNAVDDGFGDEEYGVIETIYGSVGPCSIRSTPQPESLVEEARAVHSSVLSRAGGDTVILSEASGYHATPHFSDDFGGPINLKVENQTMPMDIGPQDMFTSMIQPSRADDAPAPVFDEPMDVDYPMNDTAAPPEFRAQTPESFALEPLDLDKMEGNNRRKRQRKARKLLVDAETMISNEAFREQQEDYDDILQTVPVAPPSRKMLELCVSGDLANLIKMPAQAFRNRELLQEYRSCLVTRPFDPNFTMMEISDSSSCASMDRPSAPWEDLELNDLRPDEIEPGPAEGNDDFFDDLDLGLEFAREPDMDFPRALELNNDIPTDELARTPQPETYGENKENEEEDWSDPFGSSLSSRGRLEAYGFGSSTAHKHVDDEGKWSKRANHILKKVSTDIEMNGFADFSTVTASAKNRKQAAEQFYSLLTLVKSQTIAVEQDEPYGEIVIRAGDNFNKEPGTPKAAAEDSMRTPMRPM